MKEMHEEIDLITYIKIIYRRRWIVFGITGISMLWTGLASLSQPAMYDATTVFYPIEVQRNIIGAQIALKPKLDIRDLVVSILESRKMAGRVIDQLTLKKVWKIDDAATLQDLLKNSIRIDINRNGLIKLSARTDSAELSANIANAYVENIDYFNKAFNIDPLYNIVEVLDEAVAPNKKVPRNTVNKVLVSGIYSMTIALMLVFSLDYIKKYKVIEKLRQIN